MASDESGIVLVTAILLMALVTLVGGAMLSTVRVEMMVADNYRSLVRLELLAEAGIEEARVQLSESGAALEAALGGAAGLDGQLEVGGDLNALALSDDQPVVSVDLDNLGLPAGGIPPEGGTYRVYLRNDLQDGAGSLVDRNGLVSLVSLATLGERSRRVEADVGRWHPPVVAALALMGPVAGAGLGSDPAFEIAGTDSCGLASVRAVGTWSSLEAEALIASIPPEMRAAYAGSGPPPDVADIQSLMPGYLQSPRGMEELVGQLSLDAFSPDPTLPGPLTIGNVGAPGAPELWVVNGDAFLGPGTGYGVLIVRGEARIGDGFTWNGIVLVAGQGRLVWEGLADVRGAMIVVQTRGTPSPGLPLGPMLPEFGDLNLDLSLASGGIRYDSCVVAEASRSIPLSIMAFRE